MFGALPNSLPDGALLSIANFIRGKGNKRDAIEAAYDLLGYGLYLVVGPPVAGGTGPRISHAECPSDMAVAQEFENLVARSKSMNPRDVTEKAEVVKGEAPKQADNKSIVKTSAPVQLPNYTAAFCLRFMSRHMTT